MIGSFKRRVTLYSQQVRALNLAFSLFETGRLQRDAKVAVIVVHSSRRPHDAFRVLESKRARGKLLIQVA